MPASVRWSSPPASRGGAFSADKPGPFIFPLERQQAQDRAVKIVLSLLAGALATASALHAGTLELQPKEIAPPPNITDEDHWYFNIGAPGWLAWIGGDIGLHGITSKVHVPFDQITTHFTGVTSISAEARKGRFGVYGDLL